jgi:hypothetical protein
MDEMAGECLPVKAPGPVSVYTVVIKHGRRGLLE